MARAGAAFEVAISLHGEFPDKGVDLGTYNTKYFVEMTGMDDPLIPATKRDSWIAELKNKTAGDPNKNFDMVIWGHTYHGFSIRYSDTVYDVLAAAQGLTAYRVPNGITNVFMYDQGRSIESFDRVDDLFAKDFGIGAGASGAGASGAGASGAGASGAGAGVPPTPPPPTCNDDTATQTATTWIRQEEYSDNCQSAGLKKVSYEQQDLCFLETKFSAAPHRYVKYTCNATHARKTTYTNSDCTTRAQYAGIDEPHEDEWPLTCEQSATSVPHYKMATCNEAAAVSLPMAVTLPPNSGGVTSFSTILSSSSNQCIRDSDFNGASWTDKSQKNRSDWWQGES